MKGKSDNTKIAAIADLHVRQADSGKWIDHFKDISRKADILLICGDLTDTGDEREAQLLAEDLKACSIPVIGVLGNHDYERGLHKQIRHIIESENVHILNGDSLVIGKLGFAGVKGFGGGFDQHMLSMFGESAMKAFVQEGVDEALHLDRALARLDQEHEGIPKIVVLHYSPTAETVRGEPEQIYPFLGSSRLAEPLVRRKVSAVFHGHAHAGMLKANLSGVKVFNVAQRVLENEGYGSPFFMFEI